MENKKISVIVPIYNVENYLNRCIDSIINQTYKKLEIILVDDGSPDNCGKICDEYAKKDSRIKVIHKENGGVSSARNAGLNIATGDYIGFVDGDDWIELDMYEYLLGLSIKYKADISRCSFVYNDNIGNISKENIKIIKNEDALINCINGNFEEGVVWNKLYRRFIFQNIRFEPNIIFEDVLINYYVYKLNISMVISNICKYHYLRRQDSITGPIASKSIFDIAYVFEKIVDNEKYNKYIYKYCVKRLLRAYGIVLKDCIVYDMFEFESKNIRKKIRGYIKNILFDDIYTCRERFRNISMGYLWNIYKIQYKKRNIKM